MFATTFIDVCIVCALYEEADAFIKMVSAQCKASLETRISPQYRYDYWFTTIQNHKGEPLTLHVSWLPRYGPEGMVLHFSHVLEEYHPRFAAMTGICAGDKPRVMLGDIIVAERAFTYDNGKFVADELGRSVHQHDTLTYQLHDNILHFVHGFQLWKPIVAQLTRPPSKRQQREWLLNRLLTGDLQSLKNLPLEELDQYAPGWRRIVHELQQGPDPLLDVTMKLIEKRRVEKLQYGLQPFPFVDPPNTRCHIRPMASGSAVRSDNPFKDIQVPVRDALAIDMEGAAFCRVISQLPVIPWVVVKGISDYADSEKDDSYHQYAALASAAYVLSFLQEYVSDERVPKRHELQSHAREGPVSIHNIPYLRNPFFTGRKEELDKLARALKTGQNTTLGDSRRERNGLAFIVEP